MIKRLLQIFNESNRHFEGQEPDEKVVLLLRRHPFTVLYPLGLLAFIAVIPLLVWAWFSVPISDMGHASAFWFGTGMLYLALWAQAFYLLTIYALNTVIVTDRRIIENEQLAFFSRTVSELPTYRIQDVSTHTHGLLATMIGFGDIVVQTAASEREFVFKGIADPERVKDLIMATVSAHQSKAALG